MKEEYQIVQLVYSAKDDSAAADRLVEQYLPFIKAEAAKFIKRIPQEGNDDELSIAMFAFYEAAMHYEKHKGAFLSFAARNIRNRLIDHSRREQRHTKVISLYTSGEDGEEKYLLDSLSSESDETQIRAERSAAQDEIQHFKEELSMYGISLSDVADNCPKQERTLAACHRVLEYAKENPRVFEILEETKKLPVSLLAGAASIEKKTIERHRKYLIAILLAYTNGFEIIRGHISQTDPRKGGQPK